MSKIWNPGQNDSHPDGPELVAFALGKVDEFELEQIATHIEVCPECASRLLSLNQPADELLNQLRGLGSVGDNQLDQAAKIAAFALARTSSPLPDSDWSPMSVQFIHQYEILEEVGRGGMGVVYKARDGSLDRHVALKMILQGPFASSANRIRFRREAEMAARVRDDHIVQVYEIGEFRGLPFVVYEWIDGGNLVQPCRQREYTPKQAARLIEYLASAVEGAHRLGVVHRDLKPANILLCDSIPKIVDFGLASRWDQEPFLTHSDCLMGTPEYMSPEQALGDSKHVGPATDIYSLGAILFEMLTGRTPFTGGTPLEILRAIVHEEPPSMRRLAPNCPLDLRVITLKCLNKNPADRYESAQTLAEDLRRYLGGLPILARRIDPITRTWRWCQRNPANAILLALVLFTLLFGTGVSTTFAIYANRNAEQSKRDAFVAKKSEGQARKLVEVAQEAERLASSRAYDANALLLQDSWKNREAQRFWKLLTNLSGQVEALDLRGFEWFYWNKKFQHGSEIIAQVPGQICSVCYRDDGAEFLSVDIYGNLIITDAGSNLPRLSIQAHDVQIDCVCYCRGERWIATGGQDSLIKIWDSTDGQLLRTMKGHSAAVWQLIDSKKGLFSASEDGTIRRWDIEMGVEIEVITQRGSGYLGFALDDQEDRIVYSDDIGRIYLLDLKNRSEFWSKFYVTQRIVSIEFSPDRDSIAFAGARGTLGVLDARSGEARFPPLTLGTFPNQIKFDLDGQTLLVPSNDYVIRRLDARHGLELDAYFGHLGSVISVSQHPKETNTFLSSSADGSIRKWSPLLRPNPIVQRSVWSLPTQCGLHPDSLKVVVPGQNQVKILDIESGNALRSFDVPESPCATLFSPDGKKLVAATSSNEIFVWDFEDSSTPYGSRTLEHVINRLAISPNGRRLAASCDDGAIWLMDLEDLTNGSRLEGHERMAWGIEFDPNEDKLYSSGFDGAIKTWDCTSGKLQNVLTRHEHELIGMALSPDGRYLAIASEDGEIQIREKGNGQLVKRLIGHGGPVRSVCFSIDGTRLASGGYDRSVRLWNTFTWQEVLCFSNHSGDVTDVQFSRDGKSLVSIANGGEMRIWTVSDRE